MDKDLKTVLVVDDEPDARKLFRMILGEKYNVLVADCAKKAIELFRKEKPYVVVTDIRMPGEDGLTLSVKIKEENPEVPIIVITGHGDKQTAIDALRIGVYDFLEKPFGGSDLELAVERAVKYRSLLLEKEDHLRQLSDGALNLLKMSNEILKLKIDKDRGSTEK